MKKTYLFVVIVIFSSIIWGSSSASEFGRPDILSNQFPVVVENVLTVVDKHYVYPKMAAKMRNFVVANAMSGRYDNALSLENLLERLQADLRSVSGDNHISLHLAKGVLDRSSHIQSASESQREVDASVIHIKKGLEIGYLRFNKFSGDSETKKALTEAMFTLSSTKALIIDLRENEGGDPNLVSFLSSYFLDQDILLWSILDRNAKSVIEFRSTGEPNRYDGDICILTSSKTYSAAEAFTYTLKHLGRACVIGEATGGGAHLVQMEKVNNEIDIRIPVVRAYNPITKTNWEGTGVIPTVAVDSVLAKGAAIKYLEVRTD